MIEFAKGQNSDSETGDKRFFVEDRQDRFAFKIGYGGRLTPLN